MQKVAQPMLCAEGATSLALAHDALLMWHGRENVQANDKWMFKQPGDAASDSESPRTSIAKPLSTPTSLFAVGTGVPMFGTSHRSSPVLVASGTGGIDYFTSDAVTDSPGVFYTCGFIQHERA